MNARYLSAMCALMVAAGVATQVSAQNVRVAGVPLGSGVPLAHAIPAPSLAVPVADGDNHVPNYLPGNPTAATLWPRMVYVPCRLDEADGNLDCGGYEVSPMRGEYIYLRPVVVTEPPREPVPQLLEPAPPAPATPALPPARKKPMG